MEKKENYFYKLRQLEKAIKEQDAQDKVVMDVPLMIRLFEYFNETKIEDKDLHFIVERILKLSKEIEILGMDQYDEIIGEN